MTPTKHVFRIEGMHCGSCALLIDDALMDLPGVAKVRTSLKSRSTTVELDTALTSEAAVVDAVAALGYQAVAD
ncbi:hypothetical protein GCM10023148_06380 [Actinokineospora soli]